MAAPPLPPLTPEGDAPPVRPGAPSSVLPVAPSRLAEGVLARVRRAAPACPPSPLVLFALASAVVATGLALAALLVSRSPARPAAEDLLPYAAGSAPAVTWSPGAAAAEVSSTAGAAPSTTATTALTVHAAGAVARPGLYTVAAGARVDDLLAAAGGPARDADLDRVNLAAPLADGQRVYVPQAGKVVPDVAPGAGADAAVDGAAGAGGGGAATPVDLNTATSAQLDALPGIGPATAAAIVAYRTEHGRFRSVTQLLEVPGIGDAKLASLRPRVRV